MCVCVCDSPRHFKDYTDQRDKDGWGDTVGVKHFVYVVRLPEVWTVLRLEVCGMLLNIW